MYYTVTICNTRSVSSSSLLVNYRPLRIKYQPLSRHCPETSCWQWPLGHLPLNGYLVDQHPDHLSCLLSCQGSQSIIGPGSAYKPRSRSFIICDSNPRQTLSRDPAVNKWTWVTLDLCLILHLISVHEHFVFDLECPCSSTLLLHES